MNESELKNIVEAALLAAGHALKMDDLMALFDLDQRPDKERLQLVLDQLQLEYEGRGIRLMQVSSGYRIQVNSDLAPWISRLWEERPQKYSRALLETLGLIAYRQPITRAEIEEVRGVSVSSSIMKTLMEREWVRIVGHRDVPGRPAMYATARDFLDDFNLKGLEDLPSLAELRDIGSINAVLDLEPRQEEVDAGSDEEDAGVVVPLAEGDDVEQTDTLH
ncbi:MAG: SMC-Scp complex subunit ScpB [Gammaproteobacteria bacterium]|nr:SMC-Scp complex subunit ScpB [Gammaproteobacteria bacterium]